MSPKTLIIAVAALAAGSAVTLSASAAPPVDVAVPAPSAGPDAPQHPVPLRATILFNLLDRNGDGSIDESELLVLNKAIFSAVDVNGDGKISADEFDHALFALGGGQPHMGQFMQRGPGGFHRFGMMGPRFHRPGDPRQGELQNDRSPGGPRQQLGDNDAAQPQADGAQQNFAALDKNGDGVLSPDEYAAGAAAASPAPSSPAQ